MQVVRYDRGEMYTAHYDNKQGCVRRAATFMMYLRDVEAGGATHFPKAKAFGKGVDADGVRADGVRAAEAARQAGWSRQEGVGQASRLPLGASRVGA